jgi:hypothetical protein
MSSLGKFGGFVTVLPMDSMCVGVFNTQFISHQSHPKIIMIRLIRFNVLLIKDSNTWSNFRVALDRKVESCGASL